MIKKKPYKYTTLVSLSLLSFTGLFSMEPSSPLEPELKKLRTSKPRTPEDEELSFKRAWHAAYTGQFKEAEELLRQAALHGCYPLAIGFLARSYKKGSLITAKDAEQARHFLLIFEKWANAKYFNQRAKIKDERIRGDAFARSNPWYQQFRTIFEVWYLKHRRAQEKHFHYPDPKKGIPALVSMYVTGQLDDSNWISVQSGMQEMNSDQVSTKILTALLKLEYRSLKAGEAIDGTKKDNVLSQLQPWAVQTESTKQQLLRLYRIDLEKACDELRGNHQQPLSPSIIQKFIFYHKYDGTASFDYLNKLLSLMIRYPLSHINTSALELLQCAFQLGYRQLFDEHASHMLKLAKGDGYSDLMHLIITQPDMFKAYKYTALDENQIIEHILIKGWKKRDHYYKPLAIFLTEGSRFHADKNIIFEFLHHPTFLRNYFDSILSLLNSPKSKLRRKSFKAIVDYLAATNHKNDGAYESHVKQFFTYPLEGMVDDGTALAAYKYCSQKFTDNNAIVALQLMWMHLATSNDPQIKEFSQANVRDFFKVQQQAVCPDFNENDFYLLVSQSIDSAVAQKTMPEEKIKEFIEAARTTGLLEKLNCKNLQP